MTTVRAGVEYKIEYDDSSLLLDEKKFNLLSYINDTGSITEAAKRCKISYRTALNYIAKIESTLNISIVNTSKGGSGGGGSTTLSNEGLQILKECKKIKAIIELHKKVNEIEGEVIEMNDENGTMNIQVNDIIFTLKINKEYQIGDKIVALISNEDVFIMLEPYPTTTENMFKGKITNMSLNNDLISVKINIGVDIYADITTSAASDLNLTLGKEIYIGFKALSIATLKL